MQQTQNKPVWLINLHHYLHLTFNKRSVLLRLFWFVIATIIVIPVSAAMHGYITGLTSQSLGSGFIHIFITKNKGLSFSFLDNIGPGGIYAIQILVSLIILGIVIFTRKWYYTLLLSLAFFGGMFNVFDRAIGFSAMSHPEWGYVYNEVLDYFQFSFKWGIFNFPDVFVLIGIIGTCVLYIIFSVIGLVQARKEDKRVSK